MSWKCAFSMLLCCDDVLTNFFSILLKIVGQCIGLRHANNFQAENSRHLLLVSKRGITESCEPGEVVEGRVIYPIVADRSDISGGNTKMLQEDAVIRAASQITDRNIGARRQWRAIRAGAG